MGSTRALRTGRAGVTGSRGWASGGWLPVKWNAAGRSSTLTASPRLAAAASGQPEAVPFPASSGTRLGLKGPPAGRPTAPLRRALLPPSSSRYSRAKGISAGFSARVCSAAVHTCSTERAPAARAARLLRVLRRRSLNTRRVVSVTAVNTPLTWPSSPRMGL